MSVKQLFHGKHLSLMSAEKHANKRTKETGIKHHVIKEHNYWVVYIDHSDEFYSKTYYSKYGILFVDRPNYPCTNQFIVRVKDRPCKAFLVGRLTLLHHTYLADIHLQAY